MEFFIMTKQDIKENISMLANSQGFYGRLLNQIEEDETVLDYLHEKSIQEDWKDAVDMVISIESQERKESKNERHY